MEEPHDHVVLFFAGGPRIAVKLARIGKKEKNTMNTRLFWIGLVLVGALLFASCNSALNVDALRTESQAVALGAGTSTLDLRGD